MASTDQPFVITVVIPHLNQRLGLFRCLEALDAGHRRADEIIVVDNGSVRPPTEICNQFANVRLLHQPAPGPGLARNMGVENAAGNIIAFIDADCIPSPGWLAAAQDFMKYESAQIIGGDVRIACENPKSLTMVQAYESIFAYRMDRYISRQGFAGTGNLVMRRGVFDRVGPFAGLKKAEDRDWGQRASRMGYEIHFAPDMRVFHPARPNFAALQAKWDRQISHDMGQGTGWQGRLKWTVKALALAVSPVAEIPRIATSKRIKGLGNRAKAFICLAGIRVHRSRRMLQMLTRGDAGCYLSRWNRSDAG
ncbi:Glycosyl transferase family 2 [Sulfitobacter marinus]|uniref:Glycosyl transferase family 2 n=1 Tax=Sulfitobacter marinus TaxID=394264 RepID=A0A1I6VBT1_9RHOB|nr:glycosyltransferase [Sulfitobacter marinus]SFT11186.1 Glycosyl transferase family 2 [Sulfitobacter marinus]